MYNMFMKTSRIKVLDFIRAHPPVTCSEMSKAMKMTTANARHHLKILQEQGLVEVVGMRQTPGKGRPARLYSLSNQALGNNLPQLIGALIEEITDQYKPSEMHSFIQGVAWRLNQKYSQPKVKVDKGKQEVHLTQRLFQTVQVLNTWRYQAHWEAHSEAPRLIMSHCPFGDLPMKYPEICQMDANLLESLLGLGLIQKEKLKLDERGLKNCVFQLT